MLMKAIVLPGVYERISITSTIHESPGIRVRAFLFLNDLEMQLILFVGIPGSGKSTFYKERFFNSHMRLGLDLLNTRNKEQRFLDLAFSLQQRVVIDNTNVLKEERIKYIAQAKENRYEVIGYYFESIQPDCIQRNENRIGRDKIERVGVMAKFKQLQPPSLDEGFDTLYFVQIEGDQFVVESMVP
jgi:predicted kinase